MPVTTGMKAVEVVEDAEAAEEEERRERRLCPPPPPPLLLPARPLPGPYIAAAPRPPGLWPLLELRIDCGETSAASASVCTAPALEAVVE